MRDIDEKYEEKRRELQRRQGAYVERFMCHSHMTQPMSLRSLDLSYLDMRRARLPYGKEGCVVGAGR
jgi:hypothetical protein